MFWRRVVGKCELFTCRRPEQFRISICEPTTLVTGRRFLVQPDASAFGLLHPSKLLSVHRQDALDAYATLRSERMSLG